MCAECKPPALADYPRLAELSRRDPELALEVADLIRAATEGMNHEG